MTRISRLALKGICYLFISGLFAIFSLTFFTKGETGLMIECLAFTGLFYVASIRTLIKTTKGE